LLILGILAGALAYMFRRKMFDNLYGINDDDADAETTASHLKDIIVADVTPETPKADKPE
jgi:hypothetical protein